LAYATFFGGPNGSRAGQGVTALFVDSTGNAYIAGNTASGNFPVTPGVVAPNNPEQVPLGFVAKIDPSGKSLIFSTYLYGMEEVRALAVDAAGAIYIGGTTYQCGASLPCAPTQLLPISTGTGAFQASPRSIGIIKLNSTATTILSATYLGGSGQDFVSGLATDADDNIYVTGSTSSNDFPTQNPLQASLGSGGNNVFIVKMNSNLSSLGYSTYLGQDSRSFAGSGFRTIAVDSSKNAYVIGNAGSGFPTASGAVQMTCPSSPCAFLAKVNPTGSSLLYSTYIGERSIPSSVAVDNFQNVFVAGSPSAQFPTLTGTCTGAGFVAEINSAGTLAFSTCLGGITNSVYERGITDITLDSSENVYVVGTGAGGLTLKNPIQANSNPMAPTTPFVSAINPNTGSLLFSSLIGGGQETELNFINGVGVDSARNIYAAGIAYGVALTSSVPPTFPVFNALQAVPGAGTPCTNCTTSDGFLLKISPMDAAAAALNPALVSFAPQMVGTSSTPQAVTVFDMGSAPLVISNVSATGDFSFQNSCPAAVAPAGANCAITVTFTPTATGMRTGVLNITDSSGGSPHTVQLTGEGGQAAAMVLPTAFSFFAPLQTTAKTVITISNTGAIALQIARIEGLVAPFSETNDCGSSIVPNNVCHINVAFAPTAIGDFSGTLSINDSAADSPQIVSLSGSAVAATLGLAFAPSNGSITIVAGSSATTVLNVGGAGIGGPVSLTCAGAPAGPTCALSPSTLLLSATSPSSVGLTISTTAGSELLPGPLNPMPWWVWAFAISGYLIFVLSASPNLAPKWRWTFAPLIAFALCGCGGGTSNGGGGSGARGGTPVGNYTIVVTAQSGSTTQSFNVPLTVE